MEAGSPKSSRSDLRRAAVALVALIAIVVLAAIFVFGDDEELSAAEFLKRGDEICQKAHDEFEKLQGDRPQTASEAAALTAELIDVSQGELEEISDLNGPSELDEPLDAYLSSREKGIDQLEKGFEAAEDKDAFAYATAQGKVAAEQLDRLDLARTVGFEVCSRPLVSRAELRRQSEPPG
jgi:hypothetical protein